MRADLDNIKEMIAKTTSGKVEIVVFGEISTGKSALINALIGESVAGVDVQGGWTKEIWKIDWEACAYRMPGFEDSQILLVDTPGLNEVGGEHHADLAREAAKRADLILFVTDSDLNETEFSALASLATVHKPILLVLNKIDLYSPSQRERLLEVLGERVADIIPPKHIVMTTADPREVEYVIEDAEGKTREEWRKPPQKIEDLKIRILEILEKEGLALVALNAAMYAADKSDRVASVRLAVRSRRANQLIWSFAATKAAAVALNPMPVVDVLGGSAVDLGMVLSLSKVYGLEMSKKHALGLVKSIAQSCGWVVAGEATTHVLVGIFKTLTVGYGTVLTALPQGAAAGYGSYIVGQATKYYLEHGASWGGEAPKVVIGRILDETDKESVLEHLKAEIKKKLTHNPHADGQEAKFRDESKQ